MTTEVAPPPPLQMAAQPYREPVRLRRYANDTTMREPLDPIGWPKATAPPCTLILE